MQFEVRNLMEVITRSESFFTQRQYNVARVFIWYSGRSMVILWTSLANTCECSTQKWWLRACQQHVKASRRVMKQIVIAGEFVCEMRIHKFVRWIPNAKITDGFWSKSKFILLNKQYPFIHPSIHTITGCLTELNSNILWIVYILKCKDTY